jgi:pilus assembly protein CpaB
MGAVRIVILVFAAIIAVILALVVGKIVGHKPPEVASTVIAGKPMTQVVIARRDLPIGTRVAAGDLGWQPWPADSVNPSFITNGKVETPAAANDPTAVAAQKAATLTAAATTAVTGGGPMVTLYGAVVRAPILINEPITKAKLVWGGQGSYMAVVLQPGMRAMSISIKSDTSAGGFILPGDRVDVLQARPLPGGQGGGSHFGAETILHNVRVLAIDQASEPPKSGSSVVGSVATIEVAAADAESVAKAKAQGDMILALRSYADANAPSGGLGDGAGGGVVHIFRNGQSTDVTVTP